MTNSLTGGAADVSLRIEQSEVPNVMQVFVTANIGDIDINIDQVYILVKSIESIDISARDQKNDDRGRRLRSNNNDEHDPNNDNAPVKNINKDSFIFEEKEFQIDSAQTLLGNETYEWTYELTLSEGNIQPTYIGRFTKHQWFMQAGLSARGNDPDSGWKSFTLHF